MGKAGSEKHLQFDTQFKRGVAEKSDKRYLRLAPFLIFKSEDILLFYKYKSFKNKQCLKKLTDGKGYQNFCRNKIFIIMKDTVIILF